MLEGFFVEMFVASVMNVHIFVSWYVHFGATGNQIMKVADTSIYI